MHTKENDRSSNFRLRSRNIWARCTVLEDVVEGVVVTTVEDVDPAVVLEPVEDVGAEEVDFWCTLAY